MKGPATFKPSIVMILFPGEDRLVSGRYSKRYVEKEGDLRSSKIMEAAVG